MESNSLKYFRLILLGILIPLMFGCSKQLSRDNAANQIKQKYQLPKNELVEFNSKVDGGRVYEYHWIKEKNITYEYYTNGLVPQLFSNLENTGLIKVDKIKDVIETYDDMYGRYIRYLYQYYYVASFTDKAKPYIIGNSIKVATRDFGEVTGIIERKEFNVSEVNYTEKIKDITPFGRFFNINEGIVNRTVSFTKYDDGWRIN